MTARRLVAIMCAAEILGMAGFASFAALLPVFVAEWRLSNSQAGWISGVFFAGYMLAVPPLVGLTDRVDPRRIWLASTALGGAAALGFALLAQGVATALPLRALAGVALAGTYMPGLKILADRLEGTAQSRATAVYTACFGIGVSLSFLATGELGLRFGWRWAAGLAAAGCAAAFALVWLGVDRSPAPQAARPFRDLLDLRPVLGDRAVMARVVAYAAHNFELFGLRSWVVGFLVFSRGLQPAGSPEISPTLVAALLTLVGLPASIGGNELAMRFGRRRVIVAVMAASAGLAGLIGFAAALPTGVVVALCLVYGVAVTADSAALTASVVAAADPARRGAVMAVYSSVGFAGAFLGPLVFGAVLDAAGGDRVAGWGLAFAALGLGCAVGPLALLLLARQDSPRQHSCTGQDET